MILWLFACVQERDCAKDGVAQADGSCVEADTDVVADADTGTTDTGADDTAVDTDPPTVSDVLDDLPTCEPGSTDGRLDFDLGCADGACAGMTYAEIVDALGEEGSCEAYLYQSGEWTSSGSSCSWSDGVSADFDDDDEDGLPDDGSTTYDIGVSYPFDGGTTDGLGIGASLSCFVQAMGDPDSVTFDADVKDWVVSSANWSLEGVYVYDYYDTRGGYGSDGYVDFLYLYGVQGSF